MNALWTINMDGDIIQIETAISKGLLQSAGGGMSFKHSSRQHMIRSRKSLSSRPEGWNALLLNALSHSYAYPNAKSADEATAGQPARVASVEAEWKKKVVNQRCSALVRLTDNNDDLLVAHTSWEVPHSLGLWD